MKKIVHYIPLILINIIFSIALIGQVGQKNYKSKNVIDLKPNEIRKLTLIQLEKGAKRFPDSYLLGLRDGNLILATDISSWMEDPLFVKSEISLKNYDYLTMLERKEKLKKTALFSALLGAGGYWLVNRNAKPTPFEARNKILLGQKPNSGVLESLIGGVTGVALGIIIGRFAAKKKVSLKNQKKVIRRLEQVNFY